MTQPMQSTLARKWKVDIMTSGTIGSPVWTAVKGINECKFDPQVASVEDDNVYDDEGWSSKTKTSLSWLAELKLIRRVTAADATVYDVGQEKLRTLSRAFGAAGVAYVRIYDREGGAEAYSGFAEVSWAAEGGSTTDLETVTVTLDGKGANTIIANPDAGS